MKDFDCESDELVGHIVLGFDLPFRFQRLSSPGHASSPFCKPW
jgi:hypothetical protein